MDFNWRGEFKIGLVWSTPDVLIVHAGGKDISWAKTVYLRSEMKKTFLCFKCLFPHAMLCFSEMVPYLDWTSRDCFFMDMIKKRLNRGMFTFLLLLGGLTSES